MLAYNKETPVLLLVYNRPDTTKKVFEAIRAVQPKRLYVAADGYKDPKDQAACEEARGIASVADWDCQVKTLVQSNNLGCQKAMSQGITWFFNHEPEGIILEDDCVPNKSFFAFCSALLKKYRHDDRVSQIGGANLQLGNSRGSASYYFSRLTHVWGWAGWRRVWKEYDVNMRTFPEFKERGLIRHIPGHAEFPDSWLKILEDTFNGLIDSWAYPYAYMNITQSRLSIIPNKNLISNIGFGKNATHTTQEDHAFSKLPVEQMDQLIHPAMMIPDMDADMFTHQIEQPPLPVSPPIMPALTHADDSKRNFLSRAWKAIKHQI